MVDKPLDLSKKSATTIEESPFPSSDEQQETEKEEKQRNSKSRIFLEEEISKSGEKIRKANEQSVPFHHRNRANETEVPQDLIPGNRERTKRKITTGQEINSGTKRHKFVESPSNPNVKDNPRVLAHHDYSDKATRDCTCHEPSTSARPNCSFHFSGIEGISTSSNHGEKSFVYVHRDRICSSPTDLKHSGMYTGERPTGRKVMDTTRMSDVSDCTARATSEFSPRPSTSATARCSYDSAEVQKHSPIIHNRTHTGDTREKPFSCQLCDKRYSSKGTLARHIRLSHTREGLVKCDYCNTSFTCKGDLKRHERVHTGERPFKCDSCDKSFRRKGHLKEHTTIHSKERPFVCEVCNRGFAGLINRKKHMKIHTKEKKYNCLTCGKRFSNKANLDVHAIIHSEEKPHKCLTCGRSFAQKVHLERHKKNHKRNPTV